jgi:DNA-binding transcriptional LysR family regulator
LGIQIITLRQIEAFRAVMVTGTVTQAAKMLEVSQPAVSRMISYLEYEIGFKLFSRANRQLIPTDEGRAFYDEVERSFIGLNHITKAANAIRDYRRGHIRLITIPSLASNLMVDLVAHFVDEFPEIAVSVEVQPSQRVFEWIVSQECDIGLSTLPIENTAIETQSVVFGEAVCILPENHKLTAKKWIRPKDLDGEPFITFKADSIFRHMVDEVFLKEAVHRNMQIEARTTETICGMVSAGLGVSVIGPTFPVHVHHPGIAVRTFKPSISIELALLYSAQKPLSLVGQRFIGIVHEYVANAFGKQAPKKKAR